MKSINFFLLLALLLIINTGFSQSTKSNSKAVEKTNKIDNDLRSENPALALSESQKEQIISLQIERMNEVLAYREANSNKAKFPVSDAFIGINMILCMLDFLRFL